MELEKELQETLEELKKNNNLAEFTGLYEGDRRVKAILIKTAWGSLSWLLNPSESALIKKNGRKPWFQSGEKGAFKLKFLGLTEKQELAPASAKIKENEIVVYRTGDEYGSDAKPL